MGLEKGYVFNIKDKQYVILSVVNYNGINYGFVNELAEEESEQEKYNIIFLDNTTLKFINDEILAKELIPLFQKEIAKDLKEQNLL